jgi:uncharacterized membrane protein
MIKRFILKFRKSIWIYPTIISVTSFFAAIGIGFLDSGVFLKLYEIAPTVLLTSVDLSKNILTVIASSLITMTTFTFSTTMIVLTTYSTQFSPRTVENFLSDDKTMKALGVFMGGFVYSIMTLLFMRRSLGEQLVVSSSLAILYAIVCLIEFIRYIQHVGSYIQTTNLINRIYDEALNTIEDYKELVSTADLLKDIGWLDTGLIIKHESKQTGYVQLISYNQLQKIATQIDGAILLNSKNGDFVHNGTNLFTVLFNEDSNIEQEKIDRIIDAFTIGPEKSELQDFNFSIQKISEIALRAISPGINDPNTAIHCIRIIGVLLNKLSGFEKGYISIKEDAKSGILLFDSIDFSRELHTSFHQIIHYGKTDISVVLSIIEALKHACMDANKTSKMDILTFFEYLWSSLDIDNTPDYDTKLLIDARDELKISIF